MPTLNEDKSPLDRLLRRGLGRLESLGVPKSFTGRVQKGLDTAQGRVAEAVDDFKYFSAAGFLRASVTRDFLLDQLHGKEFQAVCRNNGVQAAVPLLCTIVREEDGAKIYGVDAGGEKKVWGSIDIEGIQRFKGRARGLRLNLDPGICNEKTLGNLFKLFKDDRYFGQLSWVSFEIDDRLKNAIGSHIETQHLNPAPQQATGLASRPVLINGQECTEYMGQPPRRFDIATDGMMEELAESLPDLKKLCLKLGKFGERAGFKGPNVRGYAVTNGWLVFNSLGLPRMKENWGFNPRYQEARYKVDCLRLKR